MIDKRVCVCVCVCVCVGVNNFSSSRHVFPCQGILTN